MSRPGEGGGQAFNPTVVTVDHTEDKKSDDDAPPKRPDLKE